MERCDKQAVNRVDGGCFCGAVRFQVTLPSKWCAHCHCSMCRRIHGAGYVTWAGFESAGFEVTRGAENLHWFESSPGARRGSCAHCHSNMLFESQRWPGETHVALGCLDGKIDRTPQAHVNYDTHVDWMAVDENLSIHSS
ncbi:GFA family protein [Elongatibacter sediminis]|uniref:GFA family protein n=1 Tax=Elongatibacter sediminis TaxID=3119006 RepID=A0AAW9RBK2_9GAMM